MKAPLVLLIVASQGYQPIEYSVPKKILTAQGITVETASNKPGKATAADGSQTDVDVTLYNVDPKKYDGIFFIGGPGALENLDNEKSYKIIREIAQLGKPFGAICISPRILAKTGVLTGKKATGWDGDEKLDSVFKKYGVIRIKKDVVTDGKIVTATCPAAANMFAQAILNVLQK